MLNNDYFYNFNLTFYVRNINLSSKFLQVIENKLFKSIIISIVVKSNDVNNALIIDNKRGYYYFEKFTQYNGGKSTYLKQLEYILINKKEKELIEYITELLNKTDLIAGELLGAAFFLASINLPYGASLIINFLSARKEISESVLRKLMYDFSEDNYLLSLFYKNNLAFLIKKANQLYKDGYYCEAIYYLNIIVKDHHRYDYLNKLCLAHIYSGNSVKAIELLNEYSLRQEKSHTYYFLRGYAYLVQMDYQNALNDYTKSIKYHPINQIYSLKLPKFIFNKPSRQQFLPSLREYVNLRKVRAEIFLSLQKKYNAEKELKSIICFLRPDFYPAYEALYNIDYNNMAWLEKSLNRKMFLFNTFRRACQIFLNKNNFNDNLNKYYQALYITKGRLALLNMNFEVAEQSFLFSCKLHTHPRAIEWLAYLYLWSQSYDKSIELYMEVLKQKPNRLPVILNIVRGYLEQNRKEDALFFIERYRGLLENNKNKDKSHLVRRNLFYAIGDLKGAWQVFRDRKICTALKQLNSVNYYPDILEIDIDNLTNKSVLILSEWGPGDELRWASVYSDLMDRVPHLSITCDPRLYNLLNRSFSKINFIPTYKRIRGRITIENNNINEVPSSLLTQVMDNQAYNYAKKQDYVALISDVLGNLRNSVETFPIHHGLLKLDSDIKRKMKDWLNSLPSNCLNIGICWKSGLIDVTRNVHYTELALWKPLFELNNINFINLQYANYADDILMVKESFGVNIYVPDINLRDDFDSVAALMSELDFVISPATAIIELAGMVGVPSLMFTNSPEIDWRIKKDGYDLWHSSIKHIIADRALNSQDERKKSIIEQLIKEVSYSENRL